LRKQGIPFELHIFPNGEHGLALATEETGVVDDAAAAWVGLCNRWLKGVFK